MSNSLTITQTLTNDHWDIYVSMAVGTLPQEIFTCLNTATSTLGVYVGVCTLSDIARLQIFTGTPIPIFGNRYVRANNVIISIPLTISPALTISTLVTSVNLLSTAYKNQINSTQVITIL